MLLATGLSYAFGASPLPERSPMNSSKNLSNKTLVYSTDPKDKAQLEEAQKPQGPAPGALSSVQSRNFVAIFRIEKNGRGGKTVTVIDGLPKVENFIKDLTKKLKSQCGVGGSYSMEGRDAVIEIQGDKRDAIKKIFDSLSIKYKGM